MLDKNIESTCWFPPVAVCLTNDMLFCLRFFFVSACFQLPPVHVHVLQLELCVCCACFPSFFLSKTICDYMQFCVVSPCGLSLGLTALMYALSFIF